MTESQSAPSPSAPPIAVDLQVDAGWVIPVEPAGLFADHSVLVNDGRIVALMPTDQANACYQPRQRISRPGAALLPGLVNAHVHAAMALFRGVADDQPLKVWLEDHIWPREGRWVSADMVRDGTLMAAAEMLRGGITTASDMYFFPTAAADAFVAAGQRAVLGIPILEFPTPYAGDPDGYLQRGLADRDVWLDEPLIVFALAPHAPYTVSDRSFERIRTYANQLGLGIQCHVHETQLEVQEGLQQHGMRPVARLEKLGMLGPDFLAVHGVHLDAEDRARLKQYGASVAHCPSSNLKLASGFAPVTELLAEGINVALGTDGAASNNRLDLWEEMRLAALLAKGVSGNAAAMPAAAALRAATLGGARALGLDAQIGSLEIGKYADLIAVDLQAPELQPLYDPISHLVYAAGREHITDVWVAGKAVVASRALTRIDVGSLQAKARYWQERIR